MPVDSIHQYTNTPVWISTPVHQYTSTLVHKYISTPVHQFRSKRQGIQIRKSIRKRRSIEKRTSVNHLFVHRKVVPCRDMPSGNGGIRLT